MTTSSLAWVSTRISAASFIGRSTWIRADLVFITSRTSMVPLSDPGSSPQPSVPGRSSPDLGGCIADQRELGPLLANRQLVALDGRGEAAVAGEGQLLD